MHRPRLTRTTASAAPNAALPPRTTPGRLDEILGEIIRDLQDDGRVLLRQLGDDDTEQILEQVQQMRTRLDCLTAGLVGRARLRQGTWARIGLALSVSEDTARHRYTDDYIVRRLKQVGHLPSVPTSLRALYEEPARHVAAGPADTGEEIPDEVEAVGAAYNRLAPVLSMLARASELPLHELARQSRCSASYLSRMLSGHRVPSWKITERFARACGADPVVLRKVWETEQLRRRQPRRPTADQHEIDSLDGISTQAQALQRLMAALRTLHVRAGQPTAQQICITSRWRLQAAEVTDVLDGAAMCDWPTLFQLVQAMGGSVDYFRPLWQAATEYRDQPTEPPPTATTVDQPSADARPAGPADNAHHLISQFRDVLGSAPALDLGQREAIRRRIAQRAERQGHS
ncbi:helix-turn-helix domain-containing protein (plasmid) [Streptomyces cynarae]|uniref:Helix-turn-helix domain-containing protein n=1 Tax=Streptomyces cynarae TaxID=2981134 RepID=A0ABY6EE91_9ACTN|nr:helix-turn-helix transcriptional regulator [Streptomyces cynarae]UXY25070.1 helix-turn-helix domain-containing protein [Streptomyces cynarae]